MPHDLKALGQALGLTPSPTTPEGETALPSAGETLRAEADAARTFAREQHAAATRKAYRSDFQIFQTWCAARGLESLPALAPVVATFLSSEAQRGAKPATIARRLAAIRYAHSLAGADSPTAAEPVKAVMRGIRRTLGIAPSRKQPATTERLLAMIQCIPDTLSGKRDRALLLLGFAGAFRRSELVALHVADIEFVPDGMRITIRRSKTDQEGAGQVIAVARGHRVCPSDAVRAWIDAASIKEGPVFRAISKGGRPLVSALTPHSVGLILKRYAAAAGLNPGQFGAHSLRAGFLTSAAAQGASIFKMMDVSRHKSADTLRGYVRDADAFTDHAGAGLL
jgi:site-specific recombinase XerD